MRRMTRTLQQNQLASGVLREGDSTGRGLDGVAFTMDDQNRATDPSRKVA
jgi:hypothetical protein